MIGTRDIRRVMDRTLVPAGFRRVGGTYRWDSDDLAWLVEPDRSPFGGMLGIEVGLVVRGLGSHLDATRTNACPLVASLEALSSGIETDAPPTVAVPCREAFRGAVNARSHLDDGRRLEVLEALLGAASRYLTGVSTAGGVVERYLRGDFAAVFVHRALRDYLEPCPPE